MMVLTIYSFQICELTSCKPFCIWYWKQLVRKFHSQRLYEKIHIDTNKYLLQDIESLYQDTLYRPYFWRQMQNP